MWTQLFVEMRYVDFCGLVMQNFSQAKFGEDIRRGIIIIIIRQ